MHSHNVNSREIILVQLLDNVVSDKIPPASDLNLALPHDVCTSDINYHRQNYEFLKIIIGNLKCTCIFNFQGLAVLKDKVYSI